MILNTHLDRNNWLARKDRDLSKLKKLWKVMMMMILKMIMKMNNVVG